MAIRDIYLKIETIVGYSPVEPDDHVTPPIQYRRDCMRNQGHKDGTIPSDEVDGRRLTALIYREYLDPGYLVPKPDKLVVADVNEPAFNRRVPGTVIYATPGDRLRIHVKNADTMPHSFHVHGLRYGIDADGSWPFGAQAQDGRRSDEICPGQTWIYTFDVIEESVGAWPFHDHYRDIGMNVNRGLFGGIIVLREDERERLPRFPLPSRLTELLAEGRMPSSAAAPAGGPGQGYPSGLAAASRHAHGIDMSDLPEEVIPYIAALDELAHSVGTHLQPEEEVLQVPLFLHQMSGTRGTPVFQSAPVNPGATFTSPVFSIPATYNYFCGIHGPMMSGIIRVQAGGPSTVNVTMQDFQFTPADVTVGVGGRVIWTNNGPSQHSVVESGGDSLPSFCFNGRTFTGNTPTVLARSGQRIRWYVFNLDLGMGWHNFHPHAQRWRFAGQEIDVRSIGPAESFTVETQAPPVLTLPPHIEHTQHQPHRPKDAREFHLRGDFLVHCHVEMHMMQGLVALVRSHQTVWLTATQEAELRATTGLPLDPGDNACPTVDLDRCANATGGRWDEVPGLPQVTMMHAVLLARSNRVLFWGYGPRADQSRIWDQSTGAYTQPVNQPQSLTADENIWSGSHAYVNDVAGTILEAGGFRSDKNNPVLTTNTERRAFTFDPTTSRWAQAADMHADRFYPTSITLDDGRIMTLYGQDTTTGATENSLELFTPGGAGAWSQAKPLPFNYFYYPWTFLLPSGELFVAGPQKPARRFDWTANPVVDNPAEQFNQTAPQRGQNMDGTAVLLPLKPPLYAPRVLIAGGDSTATQQNAEWIDLSAPTPTWQALPNLNVPRDKLNSVLLPDGRVLIAGGIITLPDGGPAEIFDSEDPRSGFELGPNMRHIRGYHSAAILLPDGSVLMGGDANGGADGGNTANERYLPSYFFKARPTVTTVPANLAYGAQFSVQTPNPRAIAEVVLMRPGAVTHGFNQAQRYVGCVIVGRTATEVQATAPANGNIAPPGYYLLFLVDFDRVPSIGMWVWLT
jgi:FtsP/CotA-like multicopper oxidase with cupredoxin domain